MRVLVFFAPPLRFKTPLKGVEVKLTAVLSNLNMVHIASSNLTHEVAYPVDSTMARIVFKRVAKLGRKL